MLSILRKVVPVCVPARGAAASGRRFSKLHIHVREVANVHVGPAVTALTHNEAALPLETGPRHLRDLHAALVGRSSPVAVDTRRTHDRRFQTGVFARRREDERVHGAMRRVRGDIVTNGGHVGDVVPDFCGVIAVGRHVDIGVAQDACAGGVDPVARPVLCVLTKTGCNGARRSFIIGVGTVCDRVPLAALAAGRRCAGAVEGRVLLSPGAGRVGQRGHTHAARCRRRRPRAR